MLLEVTVDVSANDWMIKAMESLMLTGLYGKFNERLDFASSIMLI